VPVAGTATSPGPPPVVPPRLQFAQQDAAEARGAAQAQVDGPSLVAQRLNVLRHVLKSRLMVRLPCSQAVCPLHHATLPCSCASLVVHARRSRGFLRCCHGRWIVSQWSWVSGRRYWRRPAAEQQRGRGPVSLHPRPPCPLQKVHQQAPVLAWEPSPGIVAPPPAATRAMMAPRTFPFLYGSNDM
jgi:hypothetical protein